MLKQALPIYNFELLCEGTQATVVGCKGNYKQNTNGIACIWKANGSVYLCPVFDYVIQSCLKTYGAGVIVQKASTVSSILLWK